ncbi:MAG: tetratricopeptide repeat protein [Thaumarchaeota archaeon]|nr:tetratricopeptide repeat protein [Nitrososphaerota archaeon]
MVLHAIAILVLAVGTQLAAAQDDGAAAIPDRLREIGERLESIDQSNLRVLLASLAIAAIAVGAAIVYTAQLRKQLKLAEDDVKHRLLPVLSWSMPDDGLPIRVSGAGERPSGLTIRVINAGQVSARDIVVCQNARIVGSGASPLPKMRRLGALSPGKAIDIHIPVSAEDLASAMGGGIVYMELGFSYKDGGGDELAYRVAGYMSNTILTLFGEEDATPRGGWGKPAPPGAGRGGKEKAGTGRPGGIQSAGSRSRDLAEAEPRDEMTGKEAEGLLEACDKTIQKSPGDAAAHRNRARALRVLGQHRDALAAIETAAKISPLDARTLKEKSRILSGLGQKIGAIGALNQALGGCGNDLCVHRGLALLHTALGEYGLAYAAWARAAELDPAYETYMAMAYTCIAMRQHSRAAIALDAAIAQKPDDALAHAQKGIVELNVERNEEAIATLRRAIDLDSGLADARLGIAHALYRLGREAEAADELDRAVEADPENQKAHIDRGVLMLEMGRPDEARASFEAARRLDPSMLVPRAGDCGA